MFDGIFTPHGFLSGGKCFVINQSHRCAAAGIPGAFFAVMSSDAFRKIRSPAGIKGLIAALEDISIVHKDPVFRMIYVGSNRKCGAFTGNDCRSVSGNRK